MVGTKQYHLSAQLSRLSLPIFSIPDGATVRDKICARLLGYNLQRLFFLLYDIEHKTIHSNTTSILTFWNKINLYCGRQDGQKRPL